MQKRQCRGESRIGVAASSVSASSSVGPGMFCDLEESHKTSCRALEEVLIGLDAVSLCFFDSRCDKYVFSVAYDLLSAPSDS